MTVAVAGDVFHRDLAVGGQRSGDDTDRRFDPVRSRADPSEPGEGRDQTDRAVAAHPEVGDVVEEDDPGDAAGIGRRTEQRSHHRIRSAGLVDRGGPVPVELAAEAFSTLAQRTRSEIRAPFDDHAGRLSGGVGIDQVKCGWWVHADTVSDREKSIAVRCRWISVTRGRRKRWSDGGVDAAEEMSMTESKTVTVIGAGIMGRAILAALRDAGAHDVRGTTRHAETAEKAAVMLNVPIGTDNAAAVRGAEVIILAVKPRSVVEVVAELRESSVMGEDVLLISIAAGVGIESIEAAVGTGPAVIRAMPNLPCAIGRGMTILSPGRNASEEHRRTAEAIFAPMGRVRELEEKHMDTVTGLAASGPAFFYVIIEALADGAVARGLPRDVAIEMAAQIAFGAGSMVLETGIHPAALKDQVTTPAGCTIAGILALEDGRIRSTLSRAVEVASIRAGELANG